MYTITITRSDLKFAFSVLFRYCFNSNSTHMKTATQLLRYVKKTLYYNIYYESKEDLINYIDVN